MAIRMALEIDYKAVYATTAQNFNYKFPFRVKWAPKQLEPYGMKLRCVDNVF